MLDTLIIIEDSPGSRTALETACRLSPANLVQPVYTAPAAGHDLSMGAGWAWKTWERENRLRAGKDVADLVSAQQRQYKNLKAPVVVSGRPVKAVATSFLDGNYDLLVAGSPFRGMPPETLAHRFRGAIRNSSRDLPLWVITDARPVRTITALTDGSDPAEKALGLLNRMAGFFNAQITLIGMSDSANPLMARDALNLERGFAILREKGIDAKGLTLKTSAPAGPIINGTDLLVLPFASEGCRNLFQRFGQQLSSVLFFLDGEPAAET